MKPTPNRKSVIILAMALAGLVPCAWGAADEPDGGALFKKNCTMCHGQDGKGFSAIHTPDFTSAKWQASITDEKIADVIRNGKPNTAMKSFSDKLKDDEIDALVKYIRSLNSEKK